MIDAKDLVKRCKGCQFFAKQLHLPAQVMRTIPPSWPFAMWGLDSVGPFRTTSGRYRFILVAVNKFTKWIELRPVEKVTLEEATKFMQDIVNTKNWYRKGTDLWAEFGKEAPFGRKFSSKDSVKILAVGSAPSFGRRAVCT
jgi:hypothetical protein